MKRVLVSVKSVQRDMDGKDTVVELISPGTSHEKGNAQYVRYEESSVTGLDGVKTVSYTHLDVYKRQVIKIKALCFHFVRV